MIVDAYTRVSSKAQTADMQRAAIERAAAARGDQLRTVYADKMTGATLRRPELERLRVAARAGELAGRLYVYRLDRLTRSGIRDTFELIEELRAAGVELVSIADGFDLVGPAAEIVLAVMAWAAKMERLAINERIAGARARVEERGGKWGRPRRMSPELLERARRMRQGKHPKSVRDIAVALKVPRSTLARELARKE